MSVLYNNFTLGDIFFYNNRTSARINGPSHKCYQGLRDSLLLDDLFFCTNKSILLDFVRIC